MYNLIHQSFITKFLNRTIIRNIVTTSSLKSGTYYDSLGISRDSTQSDIKSAYYKLSMKFHPDKNQGSADAAKKFREITDAYEVLGNYRLRRLYDKGILHTAGSKYYEAASTVEPEIEDDPETKFYKSRFRKTKVADEYGRTPIYDFDEWSKAHYGKNFERKRDAKLKWEEQSAKKRSDLLSTQTEYIIFGFVFSVLVIYLIFMAESSYDTPRDFNSKKNMKHRKKYDKTTMNSEGSSDA